MIQDTRADLAAIRRSGETDLPYGERSRVDRLCRRLDLDLTIRPRGPPREERIKVKNSSDPFRGSFRCSKQSQCIRKRT
jgi:hypothetical protein